MDMDQFDEMTGVERLRVLADAYGEGRECEVLHAVHGDEGHGDCFSRSCKECFSRALSDLADEAEWETQVPGGMEWPRFEDGEPVRPGDKAAGPGGRGRAVEAVVFREDGIWIETDGVRDRLGPGERIKRPARDTQEAIDADALKGTIAYWGCAAVKCRDCPARIGGKNPKERYGAESCSTARTLDLLRRQRELDAGEGL